MMKKLTEYRLYIAALVVLGIMLGTASISFSAASPYSPGYSGVELRDLSSFQATEITYTLDAADPRVFAAVSFDLTGLADEVHAGINDGQNPTRWARCEPQGSLGYTCDLSQLNLSVGRGAELQVMAR